ncbi:hypothetical protein [Anaeromyxobacter dehalogenans]|uniref:hypothetical protein n=1 Tax=Anaeromyxobacter dehalogenans TaxID=161493 RepID=UPI000304825D|nr:hypothetical protein [Anaeromyxobacter dehalogenans]
MNRIATNLLQEQLSLARRILQPQPDGQEIGVEDVLRLASVTIELHRKVSSGTPLPSVWLGGTLRASGEIARRS